MKKLALGSVQFGLDYGISNAQGKTTETETAAILALANTQGIDLIDTAQAYGSSEEVVGRLHQNRFHIVTKIILQGEGKTAEQLLEKSLKNLSVEKLYGVLFHNAQSAMSHPEVVKGLQDLKQAGTIEKMGYSVYKPEELSALIEKYGLPDLIQIPFSHLDRRFEIMAIGLAARGVEIHTRSTFLQGLFFMDSNGLSSHFESIKPYLSQLADHFDDTQNLAGFLLNYAITRPFIHKVVIGVNTASQLAMNLKSIHSTTKWPEIQAPYADDSILLPYLWK